MGEEELGTINRQSSDDVSPAIQLPQELAPNAAL